MRRSTGALALPVMAALIALGLTACDVPVAAAPVPTPTQTPVVPYGDGVLRIGGLVPTTGASAGLSAAQVAGIELAVREIDEAGGYGGVPVQVFHRDVGEPGSGVLAASFAELVAKGVDVVVGPSDPSLAAELVPLATAARIPVISPDAGAMDAAELDSGGYLFRLASGPGILAAAVTELVGSATMSVAAVDDGFGAGVITAITDDRAAAGLDPVVSAVTASGTSAVKAAADVAAGDPDYVVVAAAAGASSTTEALVASLLDQGVVASQLVLVGDGVLDLSVLSPAGELEGARALTAGAPLDDGFRARLLSADPGVTDFRFAAESYDAVMLAALAARVAGDDGGESIARAIPGVSSDWVTCSSFAECAQVLGSEDDIDYQGVSGAVDLDDSGDLVAGTVSSWLYGADGRAAIGDILRVSTRP
ncbi:ABC transporter substrate-binding protein [Amnibacterium flavum]|uniref:ABC transporter substrate-binding protein n=1 Tax=Amnibacterium flavum TaxID=2173173 RepID=UPI0014030338|nr:ABC transporter substrate-binding protein [Amnibacterium flavum]